jgi:hypothetical protein
LRAFSILANGIRESDARGETGPLAWSLRSKDTREVARRYRVLADALKVGIRRDLKQALARAISAEIYAGGRRTVQLRDANLKKGRS